MSALAGCTDTTDGDATTTTPEPTPRSEAQPTPTATDDIPIAGPSPDFGGLGLASSAFADGAAIPDRYTRSGADVNPPLSIAGVPEDAATLVLVVDDPDAVDPAGEVWLHWLVWNIPASRTRIPAAWTPTEPTVGTNDFGERDYGGPAPPTTPTSTGSNCTPSTPPSYSPRTPPSGPSATPCAATCSRRPSWSGHTRRNCVPLASALRRSALRRRTPR